MSNEEQRLKERLLAKYSDALDEMLRRCHDKEAFGGLEEEVQRLAEATVRDPAQGKDFLWVP